MSRWMEKISNDKRLGQLSIPGTHNSAACHSSLPSVQCQGVGVTDQLNHGVRFLDFRVGGSTLETLLKSGKSTSPDKTVHEALRVVHGKFPLKLVGSVNLKDVLQEVYDFLNKNPSEAVLVSIKPEGMVSFPDNTFADVIWHNVLAPAKDKWYLENKNPTLGDCRGRAVLFRRFSCDTTQEYNENNFGLHAAWGYNVASDDRGHLCVQDFCELQNDSDFDKKKTYIGDQLIKASQFNQTNSTPDKLFVNFCTGAYFFNLDSWPRKAAQKLLAGIDSKIVGGCGLVIVDFAEANDWAVVRKIVTSN